jgi:hypothetical protein
MSRTPPKDTTHIALFLLFFDLANDTRQGGANGEKDGARPKRDLGGSWCGWKRHGARVCAVGRGSGQLRKKKAVARLDEKNKK